MSLGVTDIQGAEVCYNQQLAWNLFLDALLSCDIILTLGTSEMFKTSLSNGAVFMVLQKP